MLWATCKALYATVTSHNTVTSLDTVERVDRVVEGGNCGIWRRVATHLTDHQECSVSPPTRN